MIDFNVSSDEDLGDFIQSIGSIETGRFNEATVVYNKGIEVFDDILGESGFIESNCLLKVQSYENAIVFLLCYNNLEIIEQFGIWRKNILSLSSYVDKLGQIPRFSRLKAFSPPSPFGGAMGAVAAQLSRDIQEKRKKIKRVGSKDAIGIEYDLKYSADNNEDNKTINLFLPHEKKDYTVNFFETNWLQTIDRDEIKSNTCYIATVCYGNIYAPELNILRNYRDNILMNRALGRFLVKFYYRISPRISRSLITRNKLNRLIRIQILDRLVNKIGEHDRKTQN